MKRNHDSNPLCDSFSCQDTVGRFEEDDEGAADRRRIGRCADIDGGAATPAMAQDAFSQDITTVKACASDMWRLCSDVMPGLCFESTGGTTFPGFDKPVPKGQIVCSCPIP